MQTSAAMLTALECLGIIALLYMVSQVLHDKKLDQTTILFTGIMLLSCYMEHCGQHRHQQQRERSEQRDYAGGPRFLSPGRVPNRISNQQHAVLPSAQQYKRWEPELDCHCWEREKPASCCYIVTEDEHVLLLCHNSKDDSKLFGPGGGLAKFMERSDSCALRETAEETRGVQGDIEEWLQMIKACINGNTVLFDHFYQHRGKKCCADMWMLYVPQTVRGLLTFLKLPNRHERDFEKQMFHSKMSK